MLYKKCQMSLLQSIVEKVYKIHTESLTFFSGLGFQYILSIECAEASVLTHKIAEKRRHAQTHESLIGQERSEKERDEWNEADMRL